MRRVREPRKAFYQFSAIFVAVALLATGVMTMIVSPARAAGVSPPAGIEKGCTPTVVCLDSSQPKVSVVVPIDGKKFSCKYTSQRYSCYAPFRVANRLRRWVGKAKTQRELERRYAKAYIGVANNAARFVAKLPGNSRSNTTARGSYLAGEVPTGFSRPCRVLYSSGYGLFECFHDVFFYSDSTSFDDDSDSEYWGGEQEIKYTLAIGNGRTGKGPSKGTSVVRVDINNSYTCIACSY